LVTRLYCVIVEEIAVRWLHVLQHTASSETQVFVVQECHFVTRWSTLAKVVAERLSVCIKYSVDTDYRSGLAWDADLASTCHRGRSSSWLR
jgi:hypothetical protein